MFAREGETPHTLFVLVRSRKERTLHLHALAATAQIAQDPEFEGRWQAAEDAEVLRRLLREAERRRYEEVERLSEEM